TVSAITTDPRAPHFLFDHSGDSRIAFCGGPSLSPMPISTLVLLAHLVLEQRALELARPASDTLVAAAKHSRAALAPDPAAPDDSEMSEEVEKQSAEMEELRALEEVALDPSAKPNAELLQSLRRLGLANPLRNPMQEAYEEPEGHDDLAPIELPRITDLSSFDISQVKDRYDIPMAMQPLVAQYIEFFQGPGRKWFRKWMSRSTRYIPAMEPILESRGL